MARRDVALRILRARILTRTSTALPPGSPARTCGTAAHAIALEVPAASLASMAEPILAAPRLSNGEVGHRPCRRRLSFRPRQRGANQRAVHRPFLRLYDRSGLEFLRLGARSVGG